MRLLVRLALALALALGAALACLPPALPAGRYYGSTPEKSPPPPRAAPPVPKPPRPAQGELAVLLEELAGEDALALTCDGAELALSRRGAEVVASDGRRGPWLELRGGARGIEVGGRRYAGRLVVSARGAGGLAATNLVELEDYVRGVVASELAIWSAKPALLEAQAIAARSYALSQTLGRPGLPARSTLSDSVRDQAYRGEYEASSGAASQAVERRLREAVQKTRGIVLVLDGRVLDTRFHAACGGTTAAFAGVFDEPDPGGMEPVRCPPCRGESPRLAGARASGGSAGIGAREAALVSDVAWEWTADGAALSALARDLHLGRGIARIQPVRTNEYGRWLDVRVVGDEGSADISATDLRRRLGWTHLKSAWITRVVPSDKPFAGSARFAGLGRGHGVGLCQTGARVLADAGLTSAQILRHYFPRVDISRLAAKAP